MGAALGAEDGLEFKVLRLRSVEEDAGRLISAELYGINGWDPVALSVAISALAACAFVAAIIPALRAASIDPMNALRTQ